MDALVGEKANDSEFEVLKNLVEQKASTLQLTLLEQQLVNKADKDTVNKIQSQLSNKADVSKVNTIEQTINNKADKTLVENLQNQLNELITFKKGVEKAEKEKMIASFYMLSDEDKKDVIENIDNYSLDDIEAKLSILCVRNKVSFNLDDNNKNVQTSDPITFNLQNVDDNVPDWVKALRSVASEM